MGDGGGVYLLGPQPGGLIEGNHLTRMVKGDGGGGYYPDRSARPALNI
jgi:hypothetical protein